MPEVTNKCPSCGREILADAVRCKFCGATIRQAAPLVTQAAPPPLPPRRPVPPPQRDLGDDAAMRLLLPVGRSGWAIAAGYLGLFSLLGVFAPFALATGILAVFDIKRNPKKHGLGRAWFGIVMGALGTAVLVLIAIAAVKK